MKILVDYSCRVKGGAVVHLSNFAASIAKIDNPHQYYFTLLPSMKALLPSSSRLHPLAVTNHHLPHAIWKLYYQQHYLHHLLKQYSIDLLYCPTDTAPYFPKLPLIVSLRNLWPWQQGSSHTLTAVIRWLRRLNTRLACRHATLLHFVSHASRQAFQAGGLPIRARQARVVYHGVNSAFFTKIHPPVLTKLLKPWGLTRQSYVLFVGHLFQHKNIHTLIQALAQLPSKYNNLRLVIAGRALEKEYANSLEHLVNELGLESRVVFLGAVRHSDLVPIYQGACFFVFPSILETFGMPLVEAMAAGIPLIAPALPYAHELCDDVALYFAPLDHESLARHMERLLGDDGLRRDMAAHGYERAQLFSWDNTAQQMLSLFEQALALDQQ